MRESVVSYPSFLVYHNALITSSKYTSISPDITEQDDTCFNQSWKPDVSTFTNEKTHIHLLLLAPELLELAFLEVVEFPIQAPPSCALGLEQPLWIIATIFEVTLKLTNTLPPVVRVSKEGFRKWWDPGVWVVILEICFRVGIFGKEL